MLDDSDARQRPRRDFYSLDELKKRGWTDEKVEEILGDCDIRGVNPHYAKGASLLFYLKERVHKAEEDAKAASACRSRKPYAFDLNELVDLLDETISVFMEYEYRFGYEEPKARQMAVQEMINRLRKK